MQKWPWQPWDVCVCDISLQAPEVPTIIVSGYAHFHYSAQMASWLFTCVAANRNIPMGQPLAP